MTILRKLARVIAAMVEQFSTHATTEWAQATQRELQFIENDWAAFFWAIGSIRILFRRKAPPLASYAGIPDAAQALRKKIHRRTVTGQAVTLLEASWFSWYAFTNPHPMQKTGCALAAAAMLVWACQLYLRRPRIVPADPTACSVSYRHELERQRDFFRGNWLWLRLTVILPGITLLCLGAIRADPNSTQGNLKLALAFAVLLAIGLRNSNRMANSFQQQLNDLDGVLKESKN